ncbi:hypothetical protein AAU61_04370 [Desulfocarbo indianensis]|nr:hypothetical protein AAU61_04370 [Desulfocarbo indianensis]
MKAGIVFGGSGPILVLTTYESLEDAKFAAKLASKGIGKFIAYEVDLELVKKKYGQHFDAVMKDVKQSDDLRVLDYNGHNVFLNFSFSKDAKTPIVHE